jgi:hypothetical protein
MLVGNTKNANFHFKFISYNYKNTKLLFFYNYKIHQYRQQRIYSQAQDPELIKLQKIVPKDIAEALY